MFTTMQQAVSMLLTEAAEQHARAAQAPERAPQLLDEYWNRYRTDEGFRAEIDEGAREALMQAEEMKRRTLAQIGREVLH